MPVADPAYLVDLLGPTAVSAMVKAWGGLVLDVPKRRDGQAYQRIEEVTGADAAGKLLQVFAGSSFYIPKMHAALLAGRNRMIRAEYDAGISVQELARKYGLSERQIWTILGRGDDLGGGDQGCLF